MKIFYITMRFPTLSETFAANDIRSLQRFGAQVSVHSLRGPWSGGKGLLLERDLSTLKVTHGGVKAILSGFLRSLIKPWIAFSLIIWLLRHCFSHPVHLAKSLLLVPRAVGIFAEYRERTARCRAPILGPLPLASSLSGERLLPNIVLTIFLGAYDLSREFPGTPEVARQADAVWTHAHFNIKKILSLGVPPQKIHVAYRGIDLNRIGAVDCQRIRYRIVSAGRLIPLKRMEAVLAAFQIIRNKWPAHATLVLMGEGGERPRLEKLAYEWGMQDAVAFRGHVPHDEVLAEMAAAEIFLLLSRSERLPNVAKEAMASGCACIVTATEGIDELITHGKSGFVVSQEATPEEVAEMVEKIFMDGSLRSNFQGHALDTLREHFDVDASMRKYLENWSGLLREK